jgi:hydroxymethylpyrimidine/phosphomethylpyrimidine kinase
VTLQIEPVVADIGCDAVKTGMLATAAIVEAVAAAVEALDLPNLVVDPVMVAKSGDRLLSSDAVHAVRTTILRLARVVTPNIPEAEVLAGMTIDSIEAMREAGRRLLKLGPRAVIVKGGHLAGPEAPDVLITAHDEVTLIGERLHVPHTHGTGCTFSAALAACLARGDSLETAARAAKEYVTGAMRHGLAVGGGHQPLGHFWRERRD